MSKAVRFDDYGGIEVLEVRDVARPEPGPDQVLVAVRAAAINPSEAKIRAGLVREIFPATFPSGEGSDLAGVVEEVGAGVRRVAVGDEVIGYTDNRASHAEYVLVEAANLTPKPAEVPWEVAGALFVAGVTGVATVRAVAPTAGETVVIAGGGRRRRRVRGPARDPHGRARHRTGQRAPSRVAARPRRGSRRLWRWRQRADHRGRRGDAGGRVHRPRRGRLRRAGARARHRHGPDRHDRRLPVDREVRRSRAMAARPRRARRPWPNWPRRSRPATSSSRSSAPIPLTTFERRSPSSKPATSLGRSS